MDVLDQTFKDYPVRPAIRVLTGDPPPVHDRFLIVDGSVWFSGNSLHTLGERAGVIVRLPNAAPIITELKAFWRKSQPLSEWLGNRSDGNARCGIFRRMLELVQCVIRPLTSETRT